jgi:hypothetical protein
MAKRLEAQQPGMRPEFLARPKHGTAWYGVPCLGCQRSTAGGAARHGLIFKAGPLEARILFPSHRPIKCQPLLSFSLSLILFIISLPYPLHRFPSLPSELRPFLSFLASPAGGVAGGGRHGRGMRARRA